MSTMTPARMSAETASRAGCADDPDLLFPPKDSELPGQPNAAERRALAVCAACPVRAECAREVLTGPVPMEFGVAAGMTAADRRAALAATRQATMRSEHGNDAVAPGPGNSAAPARDTADLDAVIERVLAVHGGRAHGADPATVRALALGHPPMTASRWESALAAVVMLTRGTNVAATARVLGEDNTQVIRWRDRHATSEALVRGGAGGGTLQLARPSRAARRRDSAPVLERRDAA